ncbi:bifunctional 3'-5' exonuclease/DNA polymerase [Pseudactinotalea sp. Z1739]|uniref:bifunctional 3'-5' exonuclease/DNA polymerase n=1 Tax=Pseudactinotalea sp. Z1739 TaxID=3413028 RepID=UPI003C7E543A
MEIAVAVQGPTAMVQSVQHRSDSGHGRAEPERLALAELPARVAALESEHTHTPPRWIWADTRAAAAVLLPAGVRVRRCLDLRLCHAILRRTPAGRQWPDSPWDTPVEVPAASVTDQGERLFDDHFGATGADEFSLAQVHAERARQDQAIRAHPAPGKLRLLMAAESVGALIATEMQADGVPWDRAVHEELLTAALGPRPGPGLRPAKLEDLAVRIRTHLDTPALNPDSPADVLRALRAQGLDVRTTRKGELARIDHPVIAPLLEYKKLARLLSANGWAWLDAWVSPPDPHGPAGRQGRFRPEYVPGGVVTGRWAASGGGALQLPKQVRGALRADAGWRLVVADAAQIEPRVLAAMAGDQALARAGRGGDLYQGLVDSGVVPTRDAAKVGMLGALYGGTTGDSGALMPRLRRAYPRAIDVVETAARTGEAGGVVHTWLGRTSPAPGPEWVEQQRQSNQADADAEAQRRARSRTREWGRFTRNFVVQGTAAEWALCWLGEIRRRLSELDGHTDGEGDIDGDGAHLVFFLHDEVIVHAPQAQAEAAAGAVRAAATAAGTLMFGQTAVDFPLSVSVVTDYDQAA